MSGEKQPEKKIDVGDDDSLSSGFHAEIPYPNNHPPADIVSYKSPNHSVNHSPIQVLLDLKKNTIITRHPPNINPSQHNDKFVYTESRNTI